MKKRSALSPSSRRVTRRFQGGHEQVRSNDDGVRLETEPRFCMRRIDGDASLAVCFGCSVTCPANALELPSAQQRRTPSVLVCGEAQNERGGNLAIGDDS